MHGADAAAGCGEPGVAHHTDARVEEQPAGAAEERVTELAAEHAGFLARQDGRALDRHALRQNHQVARLLALLEDESRFFDFAEHLAHQDRPVETRGDFRVAAAERHAQCAAGAERVAEDVAYKGGPRPALREQERRQKPARARTECGDIVGVDVDGVPAEALGGESDGVGLRHEVPVAPVNHRRVFTQARAEDDARRFRDGARCQQ